MMLSSAVHSSSSSSPCAYGAGGYSSCISPVYAKSYTPAASFLVVYCLHENNRLVANSSARIAYFFFGFNRVRIRIRAILGLVNGSVVSGSAESDRNGDVGNGGQGSAHDVDDMKNSPLLIALAYYGETPLAGPAANPQIVDFLKATSYPNPASDEIPWCSAFLVWCFKEAGIIVEANAAALSWQKYSVETDQPRIGDVVVLSWVADGRDRSHVGLFIREALNGIWVLGGNQNDTVDITLWKKTAVLSFRSYTGL